MARRSLDPEEVGAGAGNPGVAELVALVHRVNPSDRGLDEDERARRYALKARLQSRLIREWSDHLEFRTEGEDEGVVSIVHRGHRRDAAHAVLTALDPDARSIVRRALDLPPEPEPDDAPPAREAATSTLSDDPLSRGRRARDEWDFDTARACFEQAFAKGRGEPAAHALLELLVESLGLDGDALRVDLPDRALSARVARLVAVAAAREGDERRAVGLLRRLDGPSEAEVRVLLADRALRDREVGTARAHLDALRAIDPANGAVLRIEDGLRQLDADARAPLETALARALDGGEAERIRAAARALLHVSPSNARAREALAALDQHERSAATAARLAAADELERAGRLELVLTELERAAELGADVAARLEGLRRRLADARAEHDTAEAARALDSGELRPYLALPVARRAALRTQRREERLEQLERFVADRVRDPVAALRVLERATAAAHAGRARDALDLLVHEDLVGMTATRDLVRTLRETVAEEERRDAAALAEGISAALAKGDETDALRLADALRPELVPEPDRTRITTLLGAARARRYDAEQVEAFDDLVRRGGVFQARDLAERKSVDPAWARRARLVDERISRMIPSRVVEPWCDDLHDAVPPELQMSPDACLEPDGRHVWLAEARAHFCFLRRVEVATSRVVSCTVVRTIEPFTRPRVALLGGDVVVASKGARFLVVRPGDDGRRERIVEYVSGPVPGMEQPLYVDPGRDPARRYLMLDLRDGREAPIYGVWDTPRNAVVGLVGLLSAHPIRMPDVGDCLVKHQRDGQVRRIDPVSDRTERIGFALRIDSLARRPRGGGIVAAGGFPPGVGAELALAVLDPESPTPKLRVGLPRPRTGIHPLACSREHERIYLLGEFDGDDPVLLAFDADLRLCWTVSAPGMMQLVTDADDTHAAVVVATRRGPRVCPLGRDAPPLPADGVRRPSRVGGSTLAEELAVPGSAVAASVASRVEAIAEDRTLHDILDGVDERVPAHERFRRLDVHAVWHACEIQSLARLAEAALAWDEGPWGQRLHAVAAFCEGWMRHVQNREMSELDGLRRPRSHAELETLAERARKWLDEQAEGVMQFLRVGPDDPRWPSTAVPR